MKKHCPLLLGLLSLIIICGQWSCSKDHNNQEPIPEPEPKPTKQVDIPYVDATMEAWANKYNMPGISYSISKNGKLVYSKGFGYADKEAKTVVSRQTSFRIASVSKIITAVATLKLVDQGKIQMNQKVFGANGLLGTTYGSKPNYSDRILKITLSDLLHHTSGGWGNGNNDPAFYNPQVSQDEMISFTLDRFALNSDPNTKTNYSNFCYVLLEKIIEKHSGKSYENFVKTEIWDKVGAKSSFVSSNLLSERKANEAIYYGQQSEENYTYSFNIKRALGAGGWVSSSDDLLRLATAVDSSATRPDILSLPTLKIMASTTPASITSGWKFGCGWEIQGPEWFWTGSLPGTFSILYRNYNGICIAVVSNSKFMPDATLISLNAMTKIIKDLANNKNIKWQDIDQF